MKKVLIISYFFPPCNFVGGERTKYWSNNFHKYGIYPIIVTRCWNDGQKDIVGRVKNNFSRKEVNDYGEIHYLKYKPQIRDLVMNFKFLRKASTLIQQLLFYIWPRSINYYNLYSKSDQLLKKNKDITHVIISGRPFESYYFGYRLKKKHPHINWIPDYRDQWNTYQDFKSKNISTKLFSVIEKKIEKKWTSNSSFFITTTPDWKNRISKFINKKGVVIMNGYEGPIINNTNTSKTNSKLNILYTGTLYQNQPIENFISVVSKINSKTEDSIDLQFIGCDMIPGQIKRLEKIKANHNGNLNIIERMSKDKLHKYLMEADLFFLTGFKNVKGWYPVKLFEYAKYSKPIILFPNENSIIKDFLLKTNTGYVFKESDELEKKINDCIRLKKENKNIEINKNIFELKKFSREYQTEMLAKYLKNQIATN